MALNTNSSTWRLHPCCISIKRAEKLNLPIYQRNYGLRKIPSESSLADDLPQEKERKKKKCISYNRPLTLSEEYIQLICQNHRHNKIISRQKLFSTLFFFPSLSFLDAPPLPPDKSVTSKYAASDGLLSLAVTHRVAGKITLFRARPIKRVMNFSYLACDE